MAILSRREQSTHRIGVFWTSIGNQSEENFRVYLLALLTTLSKTGQDSRITETLRSSSNHRGDRFGAIQEKSVPNQQKSPICIATSCDFVEILPDSPRCVSRHRAASETIDTLRCFSQESDRSCAHPGVWVIETAFKSGDERGSRFLSELGEMSSLTGVAMMSQGSRERP